jgi:hypothetical protein
VSVEVNSGLLDEELKSPDVAGGPGTPMLVSCELAGPDAAGPLPVPAAGVAAL